jgi:2'-5' RNA ligase
MRTAAQWKLGMWKTMFTDQLKDIAEAYAKAPVYDPKAAAAFKELADDSVRRAEVLKQQLHIEVVDDPEPYANAKEMADDIHQKRHFLVSRANCEHPLWSADQNIAFRIVHDVMGHAVSGGDFGWQGENLACAAHFPLLSPNAQQALFTECIGQTAYSAYYRSFGPQKVALFPEFTDPSQAAENDPNHRGVHPSQMAAPTAMPSVDPSESVGQPYGTIAPHQEALGLTPLMNPTFSKRYASLFLDPNSAWSSGVSPLNLPEHGVGNAYLDHGDPLQSDAVMDNAAKVDTGWHSLQKGDGSFDRERAKLAIVNAFRVVLLSPRKDLRWNAIHYQDISHIPASTDDPKVYWDALESRRRQWNQAQGIDPNAHMIFFKFLKPFQSIIYQLNPELGYDGAREKAERTLFNWWSEEQQRIEREDAEKPADKQRSADEIERRANEALAKRLQTFIKDKTNPKTDVAEQAVPQIGLFSSTSFDNLDQAIHESIDYGQGYVNDKEKKVQIVMGDADPDELFDEVRALAAEKFPGYKIDVGSEDCEFRVHVNGDWSKVAPGWKKFAAGQYNLLTGEEGLKYGAFMGTHLKAISKISQHADGLLDAALEDVKNYDGTGHHFRAAVLNLNISGVGPKVCSFAWLLLQPMTSQLATIDTHMMDVLGHHYDKEMNNRDYFKFERELAAGRDASGYGHVPLGAFQWGMWDFKRTGEGSHQDHSAMRVLDPIHHQHVDWNAKAQNLKGESWLDQAPDWWRNTQAAREAVGSQWDDTVAKSVPQNVIPYSVANVPDSVMSRVVKTAGESEDEFHVGIALPEDILPRLAEIAAEVGCDRTEEPENFHITMFWSEEGYKRKELHEWVRTRSMPGLRFENARIDCFPSNATDDNWAVVLRLDAPEAKVLANQMMDEAEEHGLEIKRFDGGWKAHITLGWSKEKVDKAKFPDVSFRAGPLYVSIPRPLRKTADLRNETTGPIYAEKPGAMAQARLLHPGLSTPEIWKLGEAGVGLTYGPAQSD